MVPFKEKVLKYGTPKPSLGIPSAAWMDVNFKKRSGTKSWVSPLPAKERMIP